MPDNRSGQRGGSGNRWGGGHRGRGDNRGRGQYQGGENRGGQYQGGENRGGQHQRGDNRGRGNQPRGRGGDRGGGTCNPPIRDASRGNYREGSRGRGPSAFRGRESSRGGGRGGGQEDHGRIYNPGETPPYNAEVSQKENEIENSVLNPGNPTGKAAASPSTNTLPLRPGYNTQGHGILLYANYMDLAVKSGYKFFRYSIDIGPGEDKKAPSIKRCKRLVQLLLERHFASERSYIATDSRANIVASKKLAKIPHDLESFEVQDDTDYNKDKHTITIKFAGMIAFSDLIDYLTSSNKSASCRNKSQLLQALNIVVGEYPKSRSKIASIGANKHFSLNPGAGDHFSLGEGLEVIRGYFVSVRAATARLLVNVQVKNVAVYEGGSLRDLIKKRISNYEDLEKLKNLEKFLKTSRVVVTYLKKDGKLIPRQKTIKGLADPDDAKGQGERLQVKKFGAGPGDVSFWAKKEGWMTASGWVTVANWFKNKHGIDVNLNLPVINVGSKAKPSYVPADVCEVIARQPAKMKLSAKQTANMIKFAVRSPDANADSIVNQGAPLLGFSSTNSVLETFGLTPDPKLITVPGQVLPAPSLTYKGKSINPTDASWNLSSLVFYETRSALTRWTWVILGSDSTASGHNAILERIKTWAMNTSTVGIQINVQSDVPGVTVPFCGNKQQDMEDMDDAFRHLATQRLDFILVVLPSRDTSLYNTVKYLCDVKYGLLHACVVANKFNQDLRKAAQYDGNVALKVNLKLGGTNHQVGDNQLGIVSKGNTMLVGIDVTHPSPGSTENAPSIAAIVASVDSKLSQFPAQLLVQKGKQERVEGLGDLLESRLEIWKDKNGVYPENIIVYRDGVSEGQYDMVVADELPELQRACRKLCGKQKKPRISIVIVGKRHHTRFYVTEESDASKSKNPPNGTVVDRGVTEARTFDFFLQSHAALHGTARPAHYIVVHDEIFSGMKNLGPRFRNPAEVLIDLSHRLCYTYGRATKAVSICPPAYYADLACERARCYLQDYFDPHGTSSDAASPDTDKQKQMVKIHDKVKDSMFYI